jgi:hypothetical protein
LNSSGRFTDLRPTAADIRPIAVLIDSINMSQGIRRMPARPHCKAGYGSVSKSNPFSLLL